MSRRLKVAVRPHPGADGTAVDVPEQARCAELLGLDGIFVGDHLKPAGPYPESLVVLHDCDPPEPSGEGYFLG